MENDDFSCVKEITKIVHLTLPYVYNSNEINGISDTLESWKRLYVKQLQGIVVGYKNVTLTSKRGFLKLDCPVIHCNVQATFELFHPMVGRIIKGKVNRISQDHIGCLVHDTINVTVHRTPDKSTDISDLIALDHFILFKITRINIKPKFIHVKGEITDECVTLMRESDQFTDVIEGTENGEFTCMSPDFSSNISITNAQKPPQNLEHSADIFVSPPSKKKKHKKSKDNLVMSPTVSVNSAESETNEIEPTQLLDVSSTRIYLGKSLKSSVDSTDSSSQVSSPAKKKKQKKSKDKLLMSPLLFGESEINEIEPTQLLDISKKRKRKKSTCDEILSPHLNALENQDKKTESLQPKKKKKISEHITPKKELVDDSTDFSESNTLSSMSVDFSLNKDIGTSAVTPNHVMHLGVQSDVSSKTSHKKKKKSKSKDDLDCTLNKSLENETTEAKPTPILNASPKKKKEKSKKDLLTSPTAFNKSTEMSLNSSLNTTPKKKKEKSKNDMLTPPPVFQELKIKVENEAEVTPSKKKKKSKDSSAKDKDKARKKKKKDKTEKSSKKDKKKKSKVISTKKKLDGYGIKGKKKDKDKNKKSKKNKSKKDKSNKVP